MPAPRPRLHFPAPPAALPLRRQVACNRAAAAAKLGRHEESLADAELAISMDASYTKAYVRRAQVGAPPAWRCQRGACLTNAAAEAKELPAHRRARLLAALPASECTETPPLL